MWLAKRFVEGMLPIARAKGQKGPIIFGGKILHLIKMPPTHTICLDFFTFLPSINSISDFKNMKIFSDYIHNKHRN